MVILYVVCIIMITNVSGKKFNAGYNRLLFSYHEFGMKVEICTLVRLIMTGNIIVAGKNNGG